MTDSKRITQHDQCCNSERVFDPNKFTLVSIVLMSLPEVCSDYGSNIVDIGVLCFDRYKFSWQLNTLA